MASTEKTVASGFIGDGASEEQKNEVLNRALQLSRESVEKESAAELFSKNAAVNATTADVQVATDDMPNLFVDEDTEQNWDEAPPTLAVVPEIKHEPRDETTSKVKKAEPTVSTEILDKYGVKKPIKVAYETEVPVSFPIVFKALDYWLATFRVIAETLKITKADDNWRVTDENSVGNTCLVQEMRTEKGPSTFQLVAAVVKPDEIDTTYAMIKPDKTSAFSHCVCHLSAKSTSANSTKIRYENNFTPMVPADKATEIVDWVVRRIIYRLDNIFSEPGTPVYTGAKYTIRSQLLHAALHSDLHPKDYVYAFPAIIDVDYRHVTQLFDNPENFFLKIAGGKSDRASGLYKEMVIYGKVKFKSDQKQISKNEASLTFTSNDFNLAFVIKFVAQAQEASADKVEQTKITVIVTTSLSLLAKAGVFFVKAGAAAIETGEQNIVATGVGNWAREAAKLQRDASENKKQPVPYVLKQVDPQAAIPPVLRPILFGKR